MSEIQKFFEGCNLLVTGGTGFIGKILVEKLLRGLPGIEKIYLLVRPKKGKDVQERLDKYFDLEIFDTLREKEPHFFKKIIPLSGDIMKPSLGLSDEDRTTIINEVSIVIHAAATTRFDKPLEVAVVTNVNSVLEIIQLCRELKNLKAAVYVSTAFIRRKLGTIEEVVYPMPMTYEDVSNTVDIIKRRNFSKEDEQQFTKILLGDFPNTYVFSKSIAEGIINEKARDLPFCIFRFPIATSTYKEPISGWVDTVQGVNQGMMGMGVGVIHVLLCPDTDVIVHMVPADFVCNALIASAWETGSKINRYCETNTSNSDSVMTYIYESDYRTLDADVPVYNYVNGKENAYFKKDFQKFCYAALPYFMPNKAFYFPCAIIAQSTKVFAFLDFFLHMLPALLGDVFLRILGKKPIFYKIYKKGRKLLKSGEFFLLENWTIDNKNIESLWKRLSTIDKELFTFDMSKLDWYDVFVENWKGILKYIMKDDMSPEGRQKAVRRYYQLLIIHRTIQAVFLTFVIWLLWKLFSCRSFLL